MNKRKAEPLNCTTCKKNRSSKKSLILECGHTFCKTCLAKDIYNNQWFVGFSTDDPLFCPDCNSKLNDSDWQDIMDFLVIEKKVQRKIIYTYYLDREWLNQINGVFEFKKEYTWTDLDQNDIYNKFRYELVTLIDTEPSKVYFERYGIHLMRDYPKKLYTFEIDYNSIKTTNPISQQELAEYIFHPDRIRRLGVQYLDT